MKFIPNYNDKHRIWDTISFHSAFVIRCLSLGLKSRCIQPIRNSGWRSITQNYFVIDPVLKPENFVHGHLPWNDALFAEAQPLWDGARDHGLRKGITQCLMLPNHAMGFLSVSSTSLPVNLMANEVVELRLQILVQLALTTLLRLEHEMVMPPEMKFSKREKEILKWTAEGKTSAEIAIILSISENTVNFHQKNMQKKFNAPNKTQIACYAAATGII